MSPRVNAPVAVLLAAATLGACGGGGASRLSAKDYRARLAGVSKREDAAQIEVQKGLGAQTVAGLRATLLKFADAQDAIGTAVADLKPPADADAANAELARGLRDTASELRVIVGRFSGAKTPKDAIAIVERSKPRGGAEIDHALTQLRKKGYTKGS